MLEPARMIDSLLQQPDGANKRVFPIQLFDQITEILVDVLREDIKRFPNLPTKSVDTRQGHSNTVRPRR
jgi:hypothetical protein